MGAEKVRGRSARGSGDRETPEAAASPRLGGGSAGGAGRALAPQHGPSLRTPLPPGFGGTRREGTGINTLTLWLRLTGTATPGRLGHWAPRPCQSRDRRGGRLPSDWLTGLAIPGAVPPPDWLRRSDDQLCPIGEARGAAPLFS